MFREVEGVEGVEVGLERLGVKKLFLFDPK